MNARLTVGAADVAVDLGRAVSLAIELDFAGAQPRHFGAPPAQAHPYTVGAFSGAVVTGASCNCATLTITPHCNGTHTECVGHLTREPCDAHRVVPTGLLPALVISVEAVGAAGSGESTDPPPQPQDRLITRALLEGRWPAALPFAPRALVLRTLPNTQEKLARDYDAQPAPYLTRPAAQLLVERGIEHLVVDLPSIDRAHDEGRLTAHRVFFGLPAQAHELAQARRAHCTITELAFVPGRLADGPCVLALQVPAIGGDAVPSRPLAYPLVRA